MGLMREIVLAPLAPLRLTVWVSEKVAEETDRRHRSQGAVIAQMREADAAAQRGEITAEQARARQGRILASRMRGSGVANRTSVDDDG